VSVSYTSIANNFGVFIKFKNIQLFVKKFKIIAKKQTEKMKSLEKLDAKYKNNTNKKFNGILRMFEIAEYSFSSM